MKTAAIGMRMHSGWGVVVTVCGGAAALEVVDRRRIVVTDPQIRGAIQPYHFAAESAPSDAEKYLANCRAVSERLARAALAALIEELGKRDYRVEGAAVLLASGRTLPPLAKILASHPLIHTAEGEFFRSAATDACKSLGIPVTGFRERDIEHSIREVFGGKADGVLQRVAGLGKSIGPPWTGDQKKAALGAAMVLDACQLTPAGSG